MNYYLIIGSLLLFQYFNNKHNKTIIDKNNKHLQLMEDKKIVFQIEEHKHQLLIEDKKLLALTKEHIHLQLIEDKKLVSQIETQEYNKFIINKKIAKNKSI